MTGSIRSGSGREEDCFEDNGARETVMGMKRFETIVLGMVLLGLFCAVVLPAIAANQKGHACSNGISLEKASAILGVAPGDISARSFPQMVSPDDTRNKTYKVPPCSYGYRSKSNLLKRISYTVYSFNSPERARGAFDTMKRNFSTAAKVERVSGLGDAAFHVADKRFHRLVAVRGTLLVDIINPADVKLQKRVMALVLKR